MVTTTHTRTIGTKDITFEAGKLAQLAHGSCRVTIGETEANDRLLEVAQEFGPR